jgi:fucose permease
MWKMPEVRTVWVIMLATNAIEYACGTWGSTWLVEGRGFTPENAAFMITLYYAGMALGRFLSGILANRVSTWKRIGIGILGVLIAVAVLPFSAIGLFLVGLGNGSIYPNLIHLTPVNFGESVSQSIMGSQIATAYLGVMVAPPLFGLVSNLLGIQVFPWFLIVLFVIMTVFIGIFVRQLKVSGRYDKTA